MPYPIKTYPSSLDTLEDCQAFIKTSLLHSNGESKGSPAFRYVPSNLWNDIEREAKKLGLHSLNKTEQVLWIYKNYTSYPKQCLECNKDIITFISFQNPYPRNFCSSNCQNINLDVQTKKKITSNKNYGTNYPCQSEKYKKEMIDVYQERYGVNHPMQNAEVFHSVSNKIYKKKPYIFPSGKKVKVMGYENFIIDYLLFIGYDEQEIEIEHNLYIPYQFENKTKMYHPDIFIPKDNLIIEVKSTYTVTCDIVKNKAKALGTVNAGYNFRLLVWDDAEKEAKVFSF